jgi:peptidyl-prolyl cis-trans isomerase SurA
MSKFARVTRTQGHKVTGLIIGLAFALCWSAKGWAQDKIVAIVNKDVITQKDLADFNRVMRIQLSREFGEKEAGKKIEEIEKNSLDKLVEDRLILQEAEKSGIKVDESRIKGRILEIRRQYPSDADFQKELGRQGLAQADLEKRIREQLLMYLVVEQNVRGKIIVRPDEITQFYNDHKEDFLTEEERECDIVMLQTDKQEVAQEFASKFRSGQRLEELEKAYPLTMDKLVSKSQGGLRQDIERTICNLDPGELSEPVKVNDKYYIFKLLKIIPSRQLTLPEAQVRIQAYLFETKLKERFSAWLDELRGKAYIKVMD